jgi:DinB superfamily
VAETTLRKALVDQTGIAWRLARGRLVGLTDDEFFWEPVDGCWSLRRKTELRTPLPDDAAPGDWWIEGIQPAPELPPFTTIAWLVSHMILGTWNWNDIIAGGSVAPEPALPSTADGAVALWNQVISRFEQLVSDYSDDDLRAEVDAWGGHVARAFLVSHVIAEVLHHAAEVGRLRDLYRNRDSFHAFA